MLPDHSFNHACCLQTTDRCREAAKGGGGAGRHREDIRQTPQLSNAGQGTSDNNLAPCYLIESVI